MNTDVPDPSPANENPQPSKPRQVRGATEIDKNQIVQFVTTIKNAEQQVGEHIIRALQHPDTVAVITTVVVGQNGQQRVVSAALNPERMQQVQEILQAAEEEREEEEPCVGFHCLVKPRVETEKGGSDNEPAKPGESDPPRESNP